MNELQAFFNKITTEPKSHTPKNNTQYQFEFCGCDSFPRENNQENEHEQITNTYARVAAGGRSAATTTRSNCCDQETTGRTKNNRQKSNTLNETNNGDDVNKD